MSSSEQRLQRLRDLLARIEQLPVTAESERMLREVRARVVDVDTGVEPSAMLPVDSLPTLATEPGSPNAGAQKAVARPRADGPPPQRSKSVDAARPEAVSRSGARTRAGLSAAEDREWLSLVATNKLLSLDDSAQRSSAGEARVGRDRRPWTRGLRG